MQKQYDSFSLPAVLEKNELCPEFSCFSPLTSDEAPPFKLDEIPDC